MRSERTEMAPRKGFLELSNSPTRFCWLYIFLASGQILLKSAKSLLSCTCNS